MKKDLGVQPAIFPMPVLIVAAYDEGGTVQAMNAAWGTVCGADKVALCISEGHATTKAIHQTGAFTVALADEAHMGEADYLGIATGNTLANKFACSGLSASKAKHVNAPVIDQFPVALECELAEVVETEHVHFVVGTIVNVVADEAVLVDGKVDAEKAGLLTFDQFQRSYFTVGTRAGQAWSVGADLVQAAQGE